MDDDFLHRIRARPHPRFASQLKKRLDQSSRDWEPAMSTHILARSPMSQRSLMAFAIGGLHVALILAFANGLVQEITAGKSPPRIAVEFHDAKRKPSGATSSPEPHLQTFTIPVPTPPEPIDYVPETAPTGSALDEGLVTQFSGKAAAAEPSLPDVRAGIGKRFPNPNSFYPASAVRQEIEGKALVRVCVGPDGKLSEAPQIAQSTRSSLLDEAALRLARAGSYVAGSRDGAAITDCFNFQATFQLDRPPAPRAARR
jgi:TonB family protein